MNILNYEVVDFNNEIYTTDYGFAGWFSHVAIKWRDKAFNMQRTPDYKNIYIPLCCWSIEISCINWFV